MTSERLQSDLTGSFPAALCDFLGDDLGTVSVEFVEREVATPPCGRVDHDRRRRLLPRLDDLPIPNLVVVGPGWTGQMCALADEIGPRPVLLIVEAFGGQRISIPRDVELSPFLSLIGEKAARGVSWLYGGQRFEVPTAAAAVRRAKRASVVAAAREKIVTIGEAAVIIGSSRSYTSELINGTREGLGVEPFDLASAQRLNLRRIADELLTQLTLAGAPSEAVAAIWTAIVAAAEAARGAIAPLLGDDSAPKTFSAPARTELHGG